jgi:hypothetical protein
LTTGWFACVAVAELPPALVLVPDRLVGAAFVLPPVHALSSTNAAPTPAGTVPLKILTVPP